MVTPQPGRQITSSGIAGSIFTTWSDRSTATSARLPTPTIGYTVSPSARRMRVEPSAIRPRIAETRALRRRRGRSDRCGTRRTFARPVEREHHVVADRQAAHAVADLLDDSRTLVAEHHREGVDHRAAVDDVQVRPADARRCDPHEHLTGAGLVDLDLGQPGPLGTLRTTTACARMARSPFRHQAFSADFKRSLATIVRHLYLRRMAATAPLDRCHLGRLPRQRTAHRVRRRAAKLSDRAPTMRRAADGGDGWSFDGGPPKRSFGIEATAGRADRRQEAVGSALRRDPARQLRRHRARARHGERRRRRLDRVPEQRDLRRTSSPTASSRSRACARTTTGSSTSSRARRPSTSSACRCCPSTTASTCASPSSTAASARARAAGSSRAFRSVRITTRTTTRSTRAPPKPACRSRSTARSAASPPKPTTTSWSSRRSPPPAPRTASSPPCGRSPTW